MDYSYAEITKCSVNGEPRNPAWEKLAKKLVDEHPYCSICGGKEKLQAHHVKPFHLFPELELDPSNIRILCEAKGLDCHLRDGHLGEWKSWNPDIDKYIWNIEHKPYTKKGFVEGGFAVPDIESTSMTPNIVESGPVKLRINKSAF